MSIPKRHHTVPQFYLRRFAVEDQVQLVSRDDLSRRVVTSVGNALTEKYFYTQTTHEGGRSHSIESLLATQIEGPADRALKRVIDDGRPLDGRWQDPLCQRRMRQLPLET